MNGADETYTASEVRGAIDERVRMSLEVIFDQKAESSAGLPKYAKI